MRSERLLVRLDAETRQLLHQLAERQGTSLSDAARLAIREAGWRRGLSAMGDLFTDRARRVLQRANDEAVERGAGEIRPIHLLLGVLRVADGRATLILRTLGIDPDRAYEVADRIVGHGRESAPGGRGLSASAKGVLEAATAEANRLDHHYVGTEHLLLGLLDDQGSPAAEVFAEAGIAADTICAAVELQKERLARVLP